MSRRAKGLQLADTAFLGRVQGGTFIPPSFADLVLWVKPETLSGLSDNDPVTSWPDSGSQGNDLNSTLDAPTYKLNEINGVAGVRYNGTTEFLNATSVGTTSTEYTMFVVLKMDSATGTEGIVRVGELTGGYGFLKSAGSREVLHRAVADCVDGSATTNAELWSAVRTSAPLLKFFLNGSGTAVTNDTSSCNAPDGSIIHTGRFSAVGLYFDGVICEILIYEVALGDTDRQTVENYLKAKYGL